VNQLEQALEGEALARISGIKSNGVFGAFVVLLRNTTWKCGEVERLIVNYLRRQLQCGYTQSSIKDIVEHFESKGKKEQQFFEAVERLESRGIIKIVSKPFASPADGFNTSRNQGGI
jgi:hypothetical protein